MGTGRTRVDPVQVVQIRGEAEPVDCTLNILLDVGCRIRHRALRAKDVESALGCDYAPAAVVSPVVRVQAYMQ